MNLVETQKWQLEQGANQLGTRLDAMQMDLIRNYLALLHKWNRAFNLTAVRDTRQHVSRHILDSLVLIPFLRAEISTGRVTDPRVRPMFLDVGTGAGLPGLPLAIAMPDTHWILLDSNGKKARFLNQCKMQLPVTNITVVHSRAQTFALDNGQRLTGIVSRAFASLSAFANATEHLTLPSQTAERRTRLFAMKGSLSKNEVSELPNNYKIEQVEELVVPFCEAARHLLVLAPQS